MKTRRTHLTADPFDTLGFEHAMELPSDELESRYIALSRETHPDFHAGADPATQAEAVRQSADLNEAYRTLRDPWRRAEALIEHLNPGCLERTKILAPDFLAEAMELAEEVEGAESDETKHALRQRLGPQIDAYLQRIREALREGRIEHAAILIHQARYYRKALRDIDEPR